MRSVFPALIVVFFINSMVFGQGFSSGSTGADGPLDLATMSCTTCEIQLPESGVLNYTTVNVPAGKTLKFKNNTMNTPAIILAQSDVIISGSINISSPGQRVPGPGGFHGGAPNLNGGAGPNPPGFGPGGGPQQDGNRNGKWIGPLSLIPIVGGSGGSGGSQCTFVGQSPYGGGGGGAIVIASSQSISVTTSGSIYASGAGPECQFGGAGGGSGGAIRLISNSIIIAGRLEAEGAGISSFQGYPGIIRLEAPLGNLIFTGSASPSAIQSSINPAIIPVTKTDLTIASIGGYAVPAYSGTRFDLVDLMLPNQLTDPINVVVNASNIPVGTQVNITFSGSPSASYTPGILTGILESSTAILTISNLNRSTVTYLFVYATFDPPSTAQNLNNDDKDRVAKVRLESAPGAKPKFIFLRNDGTEISEDNLPIQFLREVGAK